MSTNLTESQNATVGALSGVIEVAVLQPFNYAKNSLQQGLPLSMKPSVLYRGVVPNMVNMGSCTMLQFSFGGGLKRHLASSNTDGKLTKGQEMGAGLLAGGVSALVGSPLELMMIQQQRKGGSLFATAGALVGPNITRGVTMAATREAIWTVGYMSIPPIVRRILREKYPDTFTSDTAARVPASLLGALFACYLSQPIDTIKTCLQGDIERKKFTTASATARSLYAESGITAFYRGSTFRYGRMVIAVFMLDSLNAMLGPMLFPAAFA